MAELRFGKVVWTREQQETMALLRHFANSGSWAEHAPEHGEGSARFGQGIRSVIVLTDGRVVLDQCPECGALQSKRHLPDCPIVSD